MPKIIVLNAHFFDFFVVTERQIWRYRSTKNGQVSTYAPVLSKKSSACQVAIFEKEGNDFGRKFHRIGSSANGEFGADYAFFQPEFLEGNLQNSNGISPQKNHWIHRSNVGDAGNFACCLNVRKPA